MSYKILVVNAVSGFGTDFQDAADRLAKLVNEDIASGWALLGGVAVGERPCRPRNLICSRRWSARRLRDFRLRIAEHHQRIVPSTTVHTRPPDHTSPSASTVSSMIASWPTSRPWLMR